MEPIFEVRYVATYRMVKENARKYGVGPRIPTVIVCVIVYIGLIIFSASNGTLYNLLPMYVFMTLVFSVLFFMPHFYSRTILRNVKRVNDGVQPETVVTFGDTIAYHEGIVDMHIDYHKITRVTSLKYSYKIWFAKNNGILLDTNGFTKGTFAEFKQFLREKRPDLMIPE